MKTRTDRGRAYIIGVTVTLIVLRAATAGAQQSLELPQPSPQSSSHRPKSTPLPPGNDVETIPMVQQATPPPPPASGINQPAPQFTPPSRQAEPILPAIFRGCWEGRVDYLDSIERLPGGAKVGPWTAKTYRLCYRRTGNGPFALTLTEAGIAQSSKITNATGKMVTVSTDGRTYATMRALLHFDEYRSDAGYFGGSTFPVDELTNLQCNVEADGMHVSGQVYGEHDGAPWFRASWRAVFVRSADTSPLPE